MEFISDSVHEGLEVYRLHPYKYGLVLYGIIGLLVFIARMARKEDTTYDVFPKLFTSIIAGLLWIRWLYSDLWVKIG